MEALEAALEARLGNELRALPAVAGELAYEVAADDLIATATALRDSPELKFSQLIDLCGVDFLHYGCTNWKTEAATESGFSRARRADLAEDEGLDRPRFAAVYHLLSIEHNWRLRLRVPCADDEWPRLHSVIDIWRSADWYEREAFDLFGILFEGHPDLRRLLTDYGFIGHPFRKDFPLIGNVEVRFDPERGRVIYQPVTIEDRTLVPRVIRDDSRYLSDQADASEDANAEAG